MIQSFYTSDDFWLGVPFLDGTRRDDWLLQKTKIEWHSTEGTVVTFADGYVVVYIHQSLEKLKIKADTADLVFDFTSSLSRTDKSVAFHIIYHPEGGRYRWIYPLSNKRPVFLHLYHRQTFRSLLVSLMYVFQFYQTRWRKKISLTVHSKRSLAVEDHQNELHSTDYCISLGVPGPSRSIVVVYGDQERSVAFGKYPTSDISWKQFQQERNALAKCSTITSFTIPALMREENSMMILSSVKTKDAVSPKVISDDLIQCMVIFYSPSIGRFKLKNVLDLDALRSDVSHWTKNSNPSIRNLSQLYLTFIDSFNPEEELVTSACHGDFTPWNLYTNNGTFYIFDWELYQDRSPLFFDFFHFVCQKSIFTGAASEQQIFAELRTLALNPTILSLLTDLQIEWSLYFQYYLLIRSHFYLKNYVELKEHTVREKLHIEVYSRLFQKSILDRSQANNRHEFLQSLERHLNEHHTYALLKFFHRSLTDVTPFADIDMAIPRKSIDLICVFLKGHPFVESIQKQSLSFKTYIKIYLEDDSFIMLDCIHRFQRKNVIFLPFEDLLKTRKTNGSVFFPSIFYDISYYVIFQTLNQGMLKDEVMQKFIHRSSILREEKEIRQALGDWRLSASWGITSELKQKVHGYVQVQRTNTIANKILRSLSYVLDSLKNFTWRPYPIVTFSGPDGSGKSTYLDYGIFLLEKQFRLRLVKRRHRPGLLPILSAVKHGGNRQKAETASAFQLPRQGKNSGLLSSLLRFTYYYADYLLGQLWILVRYRMWRYVIVYDRYYFDFINDSRRSNIDLPKSLLRLGYFFVHKPALNIFLHSTAEEILKRKQELSFKEIESLNQDYIQLFNRLEKRYGEGHYTVLRNKTIEGTKRMIAELFKANFTWLQ